jgi:hypothetical protein
MIKNILTVFLISFWMGLNAQSVDEIINKNIEATGGRALWSKVTSIKSTGVYVMGPGMQAPVNYINTNKPFLGAYSDFSWQGMTSKTALKDSNGWSYNPFGGKRETDPLSADRLRSIKLSADPQGLLFNYKEKKCTAEYLGLEDFDGVEVHKIRVTNNIGDMIYYYIDATSFYILKTEEKVRLAEKEEKNITVYSDFRKTSYGIMYPYTSQTLNEDGNEDGGPVQLSKIEVNSTVDLSQFDIPTKK